MERRVRGSVMNAYLKYIKKKWGKVGYEQCLRDLGLETTFKDGEYYHNEIHENILRWISREKGIEYVEEAGKFVVQNLGIIAWLVRFASVKTILERFPKNYSEVYTFGRLAIDISEDNSRFAIRLYDVNEIEEACRAWLGVCKGGLEMTGFKGKVTETKCRRKGYKCCEYTMEIEG